MAHAPGPRRIGLTCSCPTVSRFASTTAPADVRWMVLPYRPEGTDGAPAPGSGLRRILVERVQSTMTRCCWPFPEKGLFGR
jgi:hypothetical protein